MLEVELSMQGEGCCDGVARLRYKVTIVLGDAVVSMVRCAGIFGRHFLRDRDEVGGADNCRGKSRTEIFHLMPDVEQKIMAALPYNEHDDVYRNAIELHGHGCTAL
jgi:hypothetical protein